LPPPAGAGKQRHRKEIAMSQPANAVKEMFPYLRCRGAAAAIDFYTRAFGAQERFRLTEPGGRVGHAELLLGDFVLMLSDEYPEHGIVSPLVIGGTGSAIHLHVDDADAFAARAVAAGATMVREPANQFYGERSAKIRDPWGHEWMLGHQIEQVSHAEMQRRFDLMFK
jgi:PhnB protein